MTIQHSAASRQHIWGIMPYYVFELKGNDRSGANSTSRIVPYVEAFWSIDHIGIPASVKVIQCIATNQRKSHIFLNSSMTTRKIRQCKSFINAKYESGEFYLKSLSLYALLWHFKRALNLIYCFELNFSWYYYILKIAFFAWNMYKQSQLIHLRKLHWIRLNEISWIFVGSCICYSIVKPKAYIEENSILVAKM